MKVVVSACLMGRNCKYNGGNNYNARLAELLKGKEVIEVCPEVAAGMPIPRPSVEIVDGVITDIHGKMWMQFTVRVLLMLRNSSGEKTSNLRCSSPEVQPAVLSRSMTVLFLKS